MFSSNLSRVFRPLAEKKSIICKGSRTLSTSTPIMAKTFFPSLDEQKKFVAYRDQLKQDIFPSAFVPTLTDEVKTVMAHNIKCFDYMLCEGKFTRPACFIQLYCALSDGKRTQLDMVKARAVAWTLEMLQGSFLIADDMVDESLTRRGQPCWHIIEGVRALNDVAVLRESINHVLFKHCREHVCYKELFEIYTETTRVAYAGQIMDLKASDAGRRGDFDEFSLSHYDTLRKFNSSSYTTILPYRLALYFAGITDPKVHADVADLAHRIGMYFIIQDDYLDVFVDDKIKGKVGTDIQNGKCSWLIASAVELANDVQLAELKDNFGRSDDKKVAIVKRIYNELGLEKKYRKQEREMAEEIKSLISEKCGKTSVLPAEPFTHFLDMLTGRSK